MTAASCLGTANSEVRAHPPYQRTAYLSGGVFLCRCNAGMNLTKTNQVNKNNRLFFCFFLGKQRLVSEEQRTWLGIWRRDSAGMGLL